MGPISNILSGYRTENYSPGATDLPSCSRLFMIIQIIREDRETCRQTLLPQTLFIASLGIQYAKHTYLNNAVR